MRNRFPGTCPCGRRVEVNAGDVTKRDGKWVVHCSNHDTDGRKTTIQNGKFVQVDDKIPLAEQVPTPVAIDNIKLVIDLFDRAKETLLYPAMIFSAGSQDFRMTMATERASVPGSVNVCDAASRDWFGRIHRDGRFEPSRRIDTQTSTAIAHALAVLALDPAGAAAAYGKRTGVCCMCGIKLTDGRSTHVGYGPVCAKKWGLPYPTKSQLVAELKKAA